MKQAKKAKNKTCYFPKNYAPARALANQKKSQKKAKSKVAKLSQNLQKTAKAVAKSTKKLTNSAQKALCKTGRNASRNARSARGARRASSLRQRMTWREVTLTSLIGTCAVAIALTIGYSSIADPAKRSQRELEKLANAYYVEYLYPHALGKNLKQPEVILADYVQQGLPAVRLRQLLLYNNGKHASSIDAFSNQYYECDTSQTYVRYYPVEPYGPRDYTVAYGTSCEKVGSVE